NYGAAFGILSDHRWVFLLISTVAIVLLACYLFEKRDAHPLLGTALSFIIGGGIGNMIDRIIYGYVVDFVDFRLINFAVFNVADMFVCIGCALMFLWIFRYADFDEKKKPDRTENKEGLSEESASPEDAETEGEHDDAAHR
ncbi:MAG: signal peptidase II, partial [Eubacteriales bacterium]